MKKFLLISPKNRTVYNFRGELIKKIQAGGYEVYVTGPDRSDLEKIEALGVSFVEIPVNKNGTSILGDLKYCAQLRRLMKEIRPDAILGYTIKPVVYGTLAGWFSGVKNINALVTGGGYTFIAKTFKAKVLGKIVRRLYKMSFRHSHHVIFQNEDDRQEFIDRRLVKKEKTFVVNGSGVDLRHFKPAPFPKEITFFMLSRFLKSKGVTEYLEGAEIVKAKYPAVRFAILGKYEDQMQDAIEKDLVERLIEKGIVERFEETDDVRPYYENCSVYVLPSYREGTPRTVLEAMAMGRPIITTQTNGCRETVIDGTSGFLVPIKNSQAVAEKMITFIEDPALIEKMGQASLDYCKEKFDVERVNEEMVGFMRLSVGS